MTRNEIKENVCETIKIKKVGRSVKYYEEKGYSADEYFDVKIDDVPKSSKVKVVYNGKVYAFCDLLRLKLVENSNMWKDKYIALKKEYEMLDKSFNEVLREKAEKDMSYYSGSGSSESEECYDEPIWD